MKSKALTEIAKTAGKAVDSAEKLGSFFHHVFGPTMEDSLGMIHDRIAFWRWERKVRLIDKYETILTERGGSTRCPVLPKFAIPIIESATLEESDELQDIWAHLLYQAGDTKKPMRMAYIDLLRQLEALDARILHSVYLLCDQRGKNRGYYPWEVSVSKNELMRIQKIHATEFYVPVDNLMRIRCLKSYIEDNQIETHEDDQYIDLYDVTFDHQYEQFSITALGHSLVEMCIAPHFNNKGANQTE